MPRRSSGTWPKSSNAAQQQSPCVPRPTADGVMGALEPQRGGGVGDHEAFILWDVIIESQDLSRTIATTSAQVRQVIGEFDELRIVSRLQYLDHDRLVGAPRAALVLAQGL